MQYFNFDSLIDRFSTTFTIVETKGEYNDAGDWVATTNEVDMSGAIIGMTDKKVYQSNGVLTAKDKYLFMTEPLTCDFEKVFVKHGNNKYKLEENPNENFEFTGVYQYLMKWVSVFAKD